MLGNLIATSILFSVFSRLIVTLPNFDGRISVSNMNHGSYHLKELESTQISYEAMESRIDLLRMELEGSIKNLEIKSNSYHLKELESMQISYDAMESRVDLLRKELEGSIQDLEIKSNDRLQISSKEIVALIDRVNEVSRFCRSSHSYRQI
jgi:hypothetical protein